MRRLSSTDNQFLDVTFDILENNLSRLPVRLQLDTEEELEIIDEVIEIPPKTPANNYADFVALAELWEEEHALALSYGDGISEDYVCNLKGQFKEINRIYLAIRKADPVSATNFPNLKLKRDDLHSNKLGLS